MSRKLVLFPPLDPPRFAQLAAAAPNLQLVNAPDEAAALAEIADAHAFLGKITPELLARAQRLEWVQSPTASLEHYLFPELIAHPCLLSNMRGIFSDVIADHVMAFLLCFARQIPAYIRRQLAHEWRPVGETSLAPRSGIGPAHVTATDLAHRRLADCSLGVVGVGGIGAEVCRRAAAFGMMLRGVDPLVGEIPGVLSEVWPVARLEELMSASDFVVIAAPHTPETEKLIRYEQLTWMPPHGVLVNVGRGAIVDLQDLTRALEERRIGGAALDVFETEPLPPSHPLWARDDVIITPHVAAASPRIAERHFALLLENVGRFSRGEQPRNLVDKRRWF